MSNIPRLMNSGSPVSYPMRRQALPTYTDNLPLPDTHGQKPPPWPPDHSLPHYTGPYPRRELEEARFSLIDSLVRDNSMVLQLVKPRLGIASICGPAYRPVPIPQRQSQPMPANNGESGDSGNVITARITKGNLMQLQAGDNILSKNNISLTSVDSGFSDDVGGFDDGETWARNNGSVHGSRPTAVMLHSGRTATVTSPEQTFYNETSQMTSTPKMSLKRSLDNTNTPEPSKRLKLTSDPSPVGHQTGPIFQIYKCDLCAYKVGNPNEMAKHLTNCKHFSGSLYNTDGETLISVEEMLAVKNKHSKTKALVVACPDCREIFEDIFMCGLHHKYVHGSINGCYAICPITHHETITFHKTPTCKKCGVQFQKQKQLHGHWAANPDHHPLKKPTGPQMFAIHICPYCSKIFYDNFFLCKTHIIGHHSDKKEMFALEVKHVLQPMRSLDLVPFNTTPGHKNGLQMELTILNNLAHFYKDEISGTKNKRKYVTERIQTIKQLLGLK